MTKVEYQESTILAQALGERPQDREALSQSAAQIANGKGRALFESLLDVARGQSDDETAAIPRMMSWLEAMMSARAGVAGYLMARLYPIAGQRHLHATYDAIDLWMHESTSIELANFLVKLADEGVRPKLRARYESWAKGIRDKAER
jgi:hypothetical protein